MNIREQFLEVLDLKLNLFSATIEEVAVFLGVGVNYLYQIRSDKTKKQPSPKLLRHLQRFTKTPAGGSLVINDAPNTRGPTYVETTTPDGRPLKIPVAAEVGGLEAAVRAARGGTIPGHKMADYLERLAQRSAVPMTPELARLLEDIRQQPEIAI